MDELYSKFESPDQMRLLGIYPQKQQGLFLQRIKILGGRISWKHWRHIADMAKTYTTETSLHLTTRQDIELHNLTIDSLPKLQHALAETGLNTFGAGGDYVRNITICPGCDLAAQGFDLLPLAELLASHIDCSPLPFDLPRKFKISLSAGSCRCAKPYISDLGFVAQENGLITVIGAGSLGPKPDLGITLYENLPYADVLPLTIAALKLFEQLGDRTNRTRARLRHLREKLGNENFKADLHSCFQKTKSGNSWPQIRLNKADASLKLIYRLHLPSGNIDSNSAFELADSAEQADAIIRLNLDQGIELYAADTFSLPQQLAAFTDGPAIVTCPGSATCTRGLADTVEAAAWIRQMLTGKLPPGLKINISGCPNNCAHSVVADIGLVGLLRKVDGKPTQCFRLFYGGGNGKTQKLAAAAEIISADQVIAALEKLSAYE